VDEIQFSILEIEEGFTILCFRKGPVLQESRLHCLLGVLEQWRKRYPLRMVKDVQLVRDGEQLRSLNILWAPFQSQQSQEPIRFHVMKNVIDMYGDEYLEALLDDASRFLLTDKHPHEVAALLSKREIVIVVFKVRKQGHVVTLDDFFTLLPASVIPTLREGFEHFKREKESGYHVVPLPPDFHIAME